MNFGDLLQKTNQNNSKKIHTVQFSAPYSAIKYAEDKRLFLTGELAYLWDSDMQRSLLSLSLSLCRVSKVGLKHGVEEEGEYTSI